MYQPINSFGLVRVDIQKDPAVLNAIGQAISSKIQSWGSILNSLLALKSSYKTVNINYGGSSGSSSSSSGSSGSGSSSGSSSYTYNAIPLYRKTINVNYGSAPISNTIEDSSDDASPTTSSSSVGAVGQTFYTATKVIGGVAASAPASASVSASASSDSASVASPNSVGYSYRKTIG
ncbi:putative lysozyme-like protein [Episyrphus balteatus]|uniref:putative lysozyme-like protein n=1 Tax=Episyrphus balteatus TaxID=286459 RepID=UPI0024859B16|nr:putative lysozyme-like protein [Episyrphus balteatus]